MKKLFTRWVWTTALLGISAIPVFSQTTISPGTHMITTAGMIVSEQNLIIRNGGNFHMNMGILTLKKHLFNQNSGSLDFGGGMVEFAGTAPQQMSGTNIFNYFVLNNPAGLTVTGHTRVNSILSLSNGRIILGPSILTLGPSVVINGGTDANSMVVPTSTGQLRKEFSAYGNFTFPVGDADGTPEFSPVSVNVNSSAFPAGSYIGVSLKNTKYPDASIQGNYLKRYWELSQSGFTSLICNLTFQYLPADVVGNEQGLHCTWVSAQPWMSYGLNSVPYHQLHAAWVSWFGAFTGVKTTTPPSSQQILNTSIPNGFSTCYDATDYLSVGGTGFQYAIENGGSATLVAGQRISILPGSIVTAGGYLHGYISTNGNYCGAAPVNPLVNNTSSGPEFLKISSTSPQRMIRIYPNPTPDLVNIEFAGVEADAKVIIEIYNMSGIQIVAQSFAGASKPQLSLEGLPVGMYIIHAQSGNLSETARIIKRTN